MYITRAIYFIVLCIERNNLLMLLLEIIQIGSSNTNLLCVEPFRLFVWYFFSVFSNMALFSIYSWPTCRFLPLPAPHSTRIFYLYNIFSSLFFSFFLSFSLTLSFSLSLLFSLALPLTLSSLLSLSLFPLAFPCAYCFLAPAYPSLFLATVFFSRLETPQFFHTVPIFLLITYESQQSHNIWLFSRRPKNSTSICFQIIGLKCLCLCYNAVFFFQMSAFIFRLSLLAKLSLFIVFLLSVWLEWNYLFIRVESFSSRVQ